MSTLADEHAAAQKAPIDRAHEIVSLLQLANTLHADADREIGQRRVWYRQAAETTELSLGESPSVARIRAALILLAEVTDQTLAEVVNPITDRLNEIVRKVEDGEL